MVVLKQQHVSRSLYLDLDSLTSVSPILWSAVTPSTSTTYRFGPEQLASTMDATRHAAIWRC